MTKFKVPLSVVLTAVLCSSVFAGWTIEPPAPGVTAPTGSVEVGLSTWVRDLLPVIGSHSILDLSFPGTHDTFTYDLDTLPSEGGTDSDTVAKMLHWLHDKFGSLIPGGWIRDQARTHTLDLTAQLNSGIRFLDFRIMYTSGDWYSLHFNQTKQKAVAFLQQLRTWLEAHPQEVVVIWFSKHGSEERTGNDQYPDVSVQKKQAFWRQVEAILDGLLFDTSISSLKDTPLTTVLERNQRVIIYSADWVEFSGSSTRCSDSKLILNQTGSAVDDEATAITAEREYFKGMADAKIKSKANNQFQLKSLTGGQPDDMMKYMALKKWMPFCPGCTKNCAKSFHIPNMSWCPPELLDVGQLTNFYKQIVLEEAIWNDWEMPNAIYLDAMDFDGTIRTDTLSLHNPPTPTTKRYAYVDTMLLSLVKALCAKDEKPECQPLQDALGIRRAQYPFSRWDDQRTGRRTDWP